MKFTLGLLIGVAAGAAIMHYLETEEGKAFARKMKKQVEDWGNEVEDLVDDLVSKGRDLMKDPAPEARV